MELTTEDKQRIYKEVNRIFNESESVDLVHELMFKVGEYEHNYQRETWIKQCEELIRTRNVMSEGYKLEINRLESERSELRNLIRDMDYILDHRPSDWIQVLKYKISKALSFLKK